MIAVLIELFKIGLSIFIALGIVKFADFFIQDIGNVELSDIMPSFVLILMLTIVGYCSLICLENWARIDIQYQWFNSQHEQIMELLK